MCDRETDNATITAERVNEKEGREVDSIPTRLRHHLRKPPSNAELAMRRALCILACCLPMDDGEPGKLTPNCHQDCHQLRGEGRRGSLLQSCVKSSPSFAPSRSRSRKEAWDPPSGIPPAWARDLASPDIDGEKVRPRPHHVTGGDATPYLIANTSGMHVPPPSEERHPHG